MHNKKDKTWWWQFQDRNRSHDITAR